jgi:preprotein translocase subunit SecG
LETHEETQRQGCPQTQENALGTQQEYLTVAARDKKSVRRSTILLAGLFISGLLCLWFMIKESSPQTATACSGQVSTEDAQIEMAIAQLIGVRSEMFNRMGEIVKKFYEFSDVQQVKVDELVKNPFKHEIFLGNLKEKSDTEIMGQGQLRQQTKDMQLLSIVATDTGKCCVIDDRRLYEGDSIRGFNVRQIGDSTVLLESDGVEIILKLSE